MTEPTVRERQTIEALARAAGLDRLWEQYPSLTVAAYRAAREWGAGQADHAPADEPAHVFRLGAAGG